MRGRRLLLLLCVAATLAGCGLSPEQEKAQQLARQQACAQDPHCLRP